MNRPLCALVCFTALITPFLASTASQAHPVTAPSPVAAPSNQDPAVIRALKVLDRLRAVGYRWTSDQGAVKAIRAWQKANGLVVDGIAGVQTAKSLGLGPKTAIPVTGTPKGAKNAPKPPNSSQNSPKTPVEPPNIAPEPPVSEPQSDVETIIRDVWPDDVEDWAVKIAYRESRLQPGVSNSCCYGLFQIHFRANRPHLADIGITSPEQLFDARTNAQAALYIYSISGPAPWRL